MMWGPLLSLGMVILIVATTVLLTLVVIGRLDPARPRCAACRAPLDARSIVTAARCASCGADLAAPAALRPRRRFAARLTWLLLLLAAMLWPIGIGFAIYTSRMARAVVIAPLGSNLATLVPTALRAANGFVATDSIRTHLAAGAMKEESVRAAVLTEMRRTGPLPPPNRGETLDLVGHLLRTRPDDPELLDATLDFLDPAPEARVEVAQGSRPDRPAPLMLQMQPSVPFEPPASGNAPIWSTVVLRRITIDGRPVPMRLAHQAAPCAMVSFATDAWPIVLDPLEPGEHAIELEMEACLFDRFDGERLQNLSHCVAEGSFPPRPLRAIPRTLRLRVDEHGTRLDQAPPRPASAPVDGAAVEEGVTP